MPDHCRRVGGVVTLVTLAAALLVAGCTTSATSTPSTSARQSSAVRPSPPRDAIATGRVLTMSIAGGDSRFDARAAEIYLPPAAHGSGSQHTLPVLELLPGTPGAPTDWLTRGNLPSIMNAFAAAHAGRAPVVVVPDINGSRRGDTECIRTPSGADVEDYLASVVPAWIANHLHTVTTDRHNWAVAGLSEGGTCAAMLALRHPRTWAVMGDFSGLAHLTVGETNDPSDTIRQLFGGSARAYQQHDPLYLLSHGGRRGATSGWFECGRQDTAVARDQASIVRLARAAGMPTVAVEVPGKHTWPVWQDALRRMLPWLWARTT